MSPFNNTGGNNTTSWSDQHENQAKKTESEVEWQACKAAVRTAKAVVKTTAKTSWQAQYNQALETATTHVSIGATVIDCKMGIATQTASPRMVEIHDWKGNIIGMSQVLVSLSLALVMLDIKWGKAAHQAIHKNMGASILKESEYRSTHSENEYEYYPKGQQSKDWASEDKLEEEDLTLSPSLPGLGFEAMLWSALPSKR